MSAKYPGSATGETDPIAEADLAAHVAAADPHTQYQKESEKAQANGYASLDGGGQVPLSQLGNAPAGGGGGADASTTVKGISKLSTAPASPTNPIAVGDNDPRNSDQRVPTDGSVVAAKVNAALKPSGSAAAGDEALRALGSGSTQAAAGDDSRFPTTGQKNALAGTSGTPGTTNQYVTNQDSRNSDARTPTAHAASHASAGSDPVTIAESQVTGLVTDLAAKAPLASPALTGTPTVPTAAQGTNTTQAASTAYVQTETGLLVPKSLVDAKGDLLVGSADNTVIRKAVGTDGQVLTADAASAGGVKWAAAGGGGGGLPTSFLDDFSSDNLASYTFISGSSARLSVSAGAMDTAASTGDTKFVVPSLGDFADGRITMKWRHTARVASSNAEIGFVFREQDTSNWLLAFIAWNGTADSLHIQRKTRGSGTDAATAVAITAPTVGTDVWLQAIFHGNYLAVEHYTSDPRTGNPDPITRIEVTLTATLISLHGAGRKGKAGFYQFTDNVGNTYRVDDLSIEPLR